MFIRLTRANGNACFVNIDNVDTIENHNGHTVLTFTGDDASAKFKESAANIANKANGVKQRLHGQGT